MGGEHVQNAHRDLQQRMDHWMQEARAKFNKIVNRKAIEDFSGNAPDQPTIEFLEAVEQARPANQPESVDLLDDQQVEEQRSAAESFHANEARVKAVKETVELGKKVENVEFRHNDEDLHSKKNDALRKHMQKRMERGSDFGYDTHKWGATFDDKFRYNSEVGEFRQSVQSVESDEEPMNASNDSSSKPSLSATIYSKLKDHLNNI